MVNIRVLFFGEGYFFFRRKKKFWVPKKKVCVMIKIIASDTFCSDFLGFFRACGRATEGYFLVKYTLNSIFRAPAASYGGYFLVKYTLDFDFFLPAAGYNFLYNKFSCFFSREASFHPEVT